MLAGGMLYAVKATADRRDQADGRRLPTLRPNPARSGDDMNQVQNELRHYGDIDGKWVNIAKRT